MRPPSAITTPIESAVPAGSVTGSGTPALSQTARPLLVPVLTRAVEPSTAPVASLMNVARAALGFVFGNADRQGATLVSTWFTDTRAWALMYLTLAGPR